LTTYNRSFSFPVDWQILKLNESLVMLEEMTNSHNSVLRGAVIVRSAAKKAPITVRSAD